MKKAELVDAVAEAGGITKAQADAVLGALPGIVMTALKGEGAVTLPGIAKIEAKHRAARTMRNPATGGEIKKDATTVPGFKPVKPFKDEVATIKTNP